MRLPITILLCIGLVGCVAAPVAEVAAPRGSEAFCRHYGAQTTKHRVMDSGSTGHGPSGFDRHLAASAGERAYQRCLSGRTG